VEPGVASAGYVEQIITSSRSGMWSKYSADASGHFSLGPDLGGVDCPEISRKVRKQTILNKYTVK